MRAKMSNHPSDPFTIPHHRAAPAPMARARELLRPTVNVPSDAGRLPMTLPRLGEKRRLGEPIVMVTAYDFPSARAAEAAGVDLVLVGDSAATTVLGYSATTPVRLEDMLVLAAAARRGLSTPLLIGDLPFGSYEVSDQQAVAAAVRMVQEAGCDAVKLEGGSDTPAARARAIVRAGIPVMGHVGLTPQTSTALGGWKAQGRTAHAAAQIAAHARALQEAGCFAVVFEAIPAAVTEELMGAMEIPVIGIGAGPATDGQVLVFHDLLGIRDGLGPRFVKRYANLQQEMNAGVAAYAEDVRARRYPGPQHTYKMDPAELAQLRELLAGPPPARSSA
jgi:3-methyl-2-oxobutanoate hydroxymethyltransferase